MNPYNALLGVKNWVAAQLPLRTATLDLRDFGARRDDEYAKGVITIYSDGVDAFAHYFNEAPKYGSLNTQMLWQGVVPNTDDKAERVAELEGVFFDEAITLFRRTDWPVNMVECKSLKTSALIEAPYAWILFELEITL